MTAMVEPNDNNDVLLRHLDNVVKKRDKRSFEHLFTFFAPKIKAYSLARQPGDGAIADELAQIVMIKVWDKAHQFNPEKAGLSTWIYTLARNSRIDLYRKNSRHTSDIDSETIWNEQSDDDETPEMHLQDQKNRELINSALNQLPLDQKSTLYRAYIEGKTHQKIADEDDIPLGSVKSRIRIALEKMGVAIQYNSFEVLA